MEKFKSWLGSGTIFQVLSVSQSSVQAISLKPIHIALIRKATSSPMVTLEGLQRFPAQVKECGPTKIGKKKVNVEKIQINIANVLKKVLKSDKT